MNKLSIIALTAALATPAAADTLQQLAPYGEKTCRDMLTAHGSHDFTDKDADTGYAGYAIEFWDEVRDFYKERDNKHMLKVMTNISPADYGLAIGKFCDDHPAIRYRDATIFFFDELERTATRPTRGAGK